MRKKSFSWDQFSPKDKKVSLRIIHNHNIVSFEIIDQGQGMGQEDMPKSFRKFKSCLDGKISVEVR